MDNKSLALPVASLVFPPEFMNQLLQQFREIVRAEIQTKQLADFQEKLLSPKEACQLFQPKISLVTLAKWDREGRIQSHRIGGRVFYKYTEVISSLQTLKKYRKSL